MTGRPGWLLICIGVGYWAIDGSGSAPGCAPADLDPGRNSSLAQPGDVYCLAPRVGGPCMAKSRDWGVF